MGVESEVIRIVDHDVAFGISSDEGDGDAGPGPSYIEAGGYRHMYTNKTARYMAHNLVAMARRLRERPIETSLLELIEDARAASDDECPPRLDG